MLASKKKKNKIPKNRSTSSGLNTFVNYIRSEKMDPRKRTMQFANGGDSCPHRTDLTPETTNHNN